MQRIQLSQIATRAVPSPDIYASGVALGELDSGSSGVEMVLASGTDLQVSPYTGHFTAFDANGDTLWTFQSALDAFGMGVAIGDINGDGINEVAVATNHAEGKVYLLDNEGTELWSYQMESDGLGITYARTVAIGKVRNDYTNNQLVVSGHNSQLALLDEDGDEIWSINLSDARTMQCVKIADTDDDGQAELITCWEKYVYKYNHLGAQVWSELIGDDNSTVISVDTGNVTSLSNLQIAATIFPRYVGGTIKRVVLMDKDGNEIWRKDLPHGASGLKLADVNGDGYDEVIVGYGNHDTATPDPDVDTGGLMILNSAGNEIGTIALPSTVGFIDYGDANNDGKSEIVASCDDGNVYLFSVSIINSGGGMIFGALGEFALGEAEAGADIFPTSISSAEAFGTPVVTSDAYIILPSSIASAEAFGTANVTESRIVPDEIASAEAFGTPSLIYYISPTSIASAEAFGTPMVLPHVTYLPVSVVDTN